MEGKTLRLGVSGYIYRNAVLYYDRTTETFWSQMTGKGVVGPWTGKRLRWLPSEVATWKQWRERHPDTTVLDPPNPVEAYRGTNAWYDKYRERGHLMFPLGPVDVPDRYEPMDVVTIVDRDGKARCYPHAVLPEGTTGDGDLRITRKGVSVVVAGNDGEPVPAMQGYWFAWCAFYEGGTVWKPE